MRQEAISKVHSMGHPSVDKKTRLVRSRFFWKRMDSNFDEYCRGVSYVTRIDPTAIRGKSLFQLVFRKSAPEMIAFDIATLPWASSNHRYLLMVDLFSKFVELYSMADQESSLSSEESSTVGFIGMGPNVDESEIRNALAMHGIDKKISSP